MRFRVLIPVAKQDIKSSDYKKFVKYFKSQGSYNKEKDPIIHEYRKNIAANMSMFR